MPPLLDGSPYMDFSYLRLFGCRLRLLRGGLHHLVQRRAAGPAKGRLVWILRPALAAKTHRARTSLSQDQAAQPWPSSGGTGPAVDASATGVPHLVQNLLPGTSSAPQEAQTGPDG